MTTFHPKTPPSFFGFYFAAAYREINGGEVGRHFCSPFSQIRRINRGEVRRGRRGAQRQPNHEPLTGHTQTQFFLIKSGHANDKKLKKYQSE